MCLYLNRYYINSCTSEPFVYGAKELTEKYETEFIGYGMFLTYHNSPAVYFNSNNVTYEWRTLVGGKVNISDLEKIK